MLFSAVVLVMLLTGRTVFWSLGGAICTFMYGTFGYGSYLILGLCAYLGEWLTFEKKLKISTRKVLAITLTVFLAFLLFHAVSSRNIALDGYGKYIAACYTNASSGFSGYTFGGVISAIFVYPVAKLTSFIGAYVVYSVLTVASGYLIYLAFRKQGAARAESRLRIKKPKKVKEEQPLPATENTTEVREQYAQPQVAEQREQQYTAPAQPVTDTPRRQEYAYAAAQNTETDKDYGKKILFQNGEFAAESYRRNMIFNDNSYFSNTSNVATEEDYLSSFSSGKPAPKQQSSYCESYQQETYTQPVTAVPKNYVYGEKPVEELSDYNNVPVAEDEQPQAYEQPARSELPENTVQNEPLRGYNGIFNRPAEQSAEDDTFNLPTERNERVERNDLTDRTERIERTERTDDRSRVGFTDSESDTNAYNAPDPAEDKPEENRRNFGRLINEDDADDGLNLLDGQSGLGDRKSRGSSRRRSNADIFDDDTEENCETSRGLLNRTEQTPALNEQPPARAERKVSPEPEITEGISNFTNQTVAGPLQNIQNQRKQEEEKNEIKPEKHVWKKYVRPPIELLNDYPENNNVNTAEIEDNKRIIIETLQLYKIACDIPNVTIGPAITRYDVVVEDKTNVRKALNYRDAIAMELMKDNVNAYLNYAKGAISIEVPNNKRTTVGLKSMLTSPAFINSKPSALAFGFGKTIEGEVICPDITKMPHLLVAGTTGSGKSVCLRALLVSLLYKYGPEDLRLILVDPKQLEFVCYENLPHLMVNEILYDINQVIKALNWAIKEMERRYSLFKEMTSAGSAVANLSEYNAKVTDPAEKLPKIVIVLDEFGDLMLQSKKDIESRIIRLAQKSRAAGIHLVLATQRPSVDCITGLIKSNLPSRIGFKVNSFEDSRIIFDIGGAEKLLGIGDCYFRSASSPDLTRIQGCWVSPEEAQKVTDFVKANNETFFDQGVSDFINTVEEEPQNGSGNIDSGDEVVETKIDDTFIKALRYCVQANQASVSMIQRRFPIGYMKACKIIDWMTNMNYITPSEGSKPRKLILTMDEFVRIYGDDIED